MGIGLVSTMIMLLALQASEATVTGVIRGVESGEPLAGAVVMLTDVGRTVVSDADGRYRFRDVQAGPHHITVRRIGYSQQALHALVPARGELQINVMLVALPARLRKVQITPDVAVRGAEAPDDASRAWRAVSASAVRNHPMLAESDPLLALAGGGVSMRLETPTGVHLRGGASDQTEFVLDGIPVFSPYHAGGTFSAWNPDALASVEVHAPHGGSDGLSGTVAGATRAAGSSLRGRGSVSTTQGRATVDGPLGDDGVGFLLSVRSGFLGFLNRSSEASYLKGETGDVIAKLDVPVARGTLRFVAYDAENEINTAAYAIDPASVYAPGDRNEFAWHSQSLGVQWTRTSGALTQRLAVWRATSEASAAWNPEERAGARLTSDREDFGVSASGEWRSLGGVTTAGLRMRPSRTRYDATSTNDSTPGLSLAGRAVLTTAFAGHARMVGRTLRADVAVSAASDTRRVYTTPSVQLRWHASPRITATGGYERSLQFAQSLRNSESVVGSVFPVDLHVSSAAPGVPVARSGHATLGATFGISDGAYLSAQLHDRTFDGLVLVAPTTGEPFADRGFSVGSGRAQGVSLELAKRAARYGLIASYGWQNIRLEHGGSTYVPDYGVTHLFEAGGIVFPASTWSVRLGLTGAAGRRTTAVSEPFEWESCNLLDNGCELVGSPQHDSKRLGSTRLSSYLRADLGVRKHWHMHLGDRDTQLGLFGTVTNLLGRRNVFTLAPMATTGTSVIPMRPRAPLVVGLDWLF